tara:strand:+ start:166 stop:603 length:438 start_codon:yes stop_codon:yes gene_type:complete
MALTGNWNKITFEPNTDVTDTTSTTYPADIPSDDPNYDLRGQTVEETFNPSEKVTTSYSNVYIMIRSISVDANDVGVGPDTMNKLVKYETCYRVYESEAARRADIDDYTHQEFIFDISYDPAQDLFDQAYTQLKTLEGFESVIDA